MNILTRIAAATAVAMLPFAAGAATVNVVDEAVDETDVIATAEMHIGDRGGSAVTELKVDERLTPGIDDETNFAWVNDVDYQFSVAYSLGTLSLTIGQTIVSSAIDLVGADAIYVTVRGNAGGTMTLSDLAFNGLAFSDPTAVGTNGNREWLALKGIDAASDWLLTGAVTFSGVPLTRQNSRWNATVKIADTPSPIPLPAPAFLLLAGLGGLAAMKRRTG